MPDHGHDENSAPAEQQVDPQPSVRGADRAQGIPGAEPPLEEQAARVGKRSLAAAGLRSIWETTRRGVGSMGPRRTLRTLTALNQKDGFDCPSCAWPDPDGERKTAEFCENGAKAVASEATPRARHARVLRAARDLRAARARATTGSSSRGASRTR